MTIDDAMALVIEQRDEVGNRLFVVQVGSLLLQAGSLNVLRARVEWVLRG